MIPIFRRIRKQLADDNKPLRYMRYAIGEIVLVVIGIVIALQINNWNEVRKSNALLGQYKQNIISELKIDLLRLNEMDSARNSRKESILKYVNYFNTDHPDLQILNSKVDSAEITLDAFPTATYTIEDLITTGNLKLFSTGQRKAILKYKNSRDRYLFQEQKLIDYVIAMTNEFEKKIDLLFDYGYSGKEHSEVRKWRYNLDSPQYRLFNNEIATFLELFRFQDVVYDILRRKTSELLEVLKQK